MRRTYRSGKDEGGLERRALISAIDAKSTIFDAFYIQNIKHTKRELSRVDSIGKIDSNKVHRRKYVKRIVRDVPMLGKETSRNGKFCSAHLTPNKSIHVMKKPDPFDLLLISSPVINKNPELCQRVSEKKYSEWKTKNEKGFNYSSNKTTDTDNESDLCTNDTNQNNTSVKSHNLIIESENISVPDKHEDSITGMVKKMSLVRNVSGFQFQSKGNSHRLTSTTDQKSLCPGKSPQCSTPFQEKYRSESIYNISPITISFCDSEKLFESNVYVQDNCKISNDDNDQIEDINNDSADNTEFLLSSYSFNKTCENSKKCLTEDLITSQVIVINTSDPIQITPESSFDSSEMAPLVGFSGSVITTVNNKDQGDTKSTSATTTLIKNTLCNNENCSKYSHYSTNCYISVTNGDEDKSNNSGLTSEIETTESDLLYDTCNDNESMVSASVSASSYPVLKRLNDSLYYKYHNKKGDLEVGNSQSIRDSSDDNDILDSFYCQEIVNLTNLKNESCNMNFGEDIVNEDNSIIEEKTNINSEVGHGLCDSLEDNEFLSFVTIRRRNAVTNNSVINISDNSNTSSSSSDKSVVSNNMDDSSMKCKRCINTRQETEEEKSILTCANYSLRNDTFKKLDETDNEKRFKTYTTVIDESIKSNLTAHQNIESEIDVPKLKFDTDSEVKTPVVLQPGKKWERSLSIYKRMTMVDSFDHSLLDSESTEHKGRKYRQSVIAMMEMQKFRGTLHNESFNGRRSTFVCKPSRSTIKILKENKHTRLSICSSTTYEDIKGLVSDDCDDTIVDLSKLSIDGSVHEVTVLEKLHDTSRDSNARDFVLRRCDQTDVLLFDECYPDTELKNCHKIGEGVYGEVYLWRARDGRARILKVIPIAGDIRVNGEPQKGYHEIISEIVIAMELSALRAPIAEIEQRLDEGEDIDASLLHSVQNATDVFNEVLAARCVRGRYPARLLELWELYDECRGSDNDCPAALPARQQYLVLELRNGGQDLESYSFNSAEQAHALFLQLALGLAVAEEALQFEHRDLHWGNVLVSPTEQKFATFVLRGRVVRVARRGVACAVIDYSLSRLTLGDAALYADLAADDTLFEAVGDRQFTVYRLMRDRVNNDWKNFEPYTNVLWLEYVADKMVTALRYKRTNTKIHKHYIAKLKAIKNRLLDYGSAAQFVLTDNEF